MKVIKLIWLTSILTFLVGDLDAQITENAVDSLGFKQGYWREFRVPINVVTEEIGIKIPEISSEYYYLTKDKDRKYFPIIECVGKYYNGLKIGIWYEYYGNGILKNQIEYKNGVPYGDCITFWGNGNLKEKFTISFCDSISITTYDIDGKFLFEKIAPILIPPQL